MTTALTLLRNVFPSGNTPVLPPDVVRTSTPITNMTGNTFSNVIMDGGLMNNMKLPIINFNIAAFSVGLTGSGAFYTSSFNGDVDFNIIAGLPKGWNCVIVQLGTNTLRFTSDVGVNILHRNNHSRLAGQYAVASFVVVDDAGTMVSLSGDTKS